MVSISAWCWKQWYEWSLTVMLSSMLHYRPTTTAAQRIACDGSCKSCGSHGGKEQLKGGVQGKATAEELCCDSPTILRCHEITQQTGLDWQAQAISWRLWINGGKNPAFKEQKKDLAYLNEPSWWWCSDRGSLGETSSQAHLNVPRPSKAWSQWEVFPLGFLDIPYS